MPLYTTYMYFKKNCSNYQVGVIQWGFRNHNGSTFIDLLSFFMYVLPMDMPSVI